jgi:hypothetical protein
MTPTNHDRRAGPGWSGFPTKTPDTLTAQHNEPRPPCGPGSPPAVKKEVSGCCSTSNRDHDQTLGMVRVGVREAAALFHARRQGPRHSCARTFSTRSTRRAWRGSSSTGRREVTSDRRIRRAPSRLHLFAEMHIGAGRRVRGRACHIRSVYVAGAGGAR